MWGSLKTPVQRFLSATGLSSQSVLPKKKRQKRENKRRWICSPGPRWCVWLWPVGGSAGASAAVSVALADGAEQDKDHEATRLGREAQMYKISAGENDCT